MYEEHYFGVDIEWSMLSLVVTKRLMMKIKTINGDILIHVTLNENIVFVTSTIVYEFTYVT